MMMKEKVSKAAAPADETSATPQFPMRVVSMYGHTFDLDQIASTSLESNAVVLTFRNADRIHLSWRDGSERKAVLKALELLEVDPGEKMHS